MAKEFHLAVGDGGARKNARVQIGKAKSLLTPILKVTAAGEPVGSARIHTGGREDVTAEGLIKGDPDIDLEHIGQILEGGTRAFFKPSANPKPEGGFQITEVITLPDGTTKERAFAKKKANTNDTHPIVLGKRMSKAEAFRQFAFTNHFLLAHSDGLQYEFLYGLAKELSDKKEVARLGAGPKGDQPLIFMDGGLPYRAFLCGEVNGDSYRLQVLLSNQELKRPGTPAPTATTKPTPATEKSVPKIDV